MQAIEFETTPERDSIRLPPGVPSGIPLRVVLLWDAVRTPDEDLKDLFAGATEGLTAADLECPHDTGRAEPPPSSMAWSS